jgi:hypothetical protein
MTTSQQQLRRAREHRLVAIKQMVGRHYSENGSKDRVPINMIAFLVRTLVPHLAPRKPRCLITTQFPQSAAQAENLELRLNEQMVESKLGGVFRRWITNALFGLAPLKVAIDPENESVDAYVDEIDLDDWVHDQAARRFDHVAFMGHRSRVPMERVHDNPFYGSKRHRVQATSKERIDNIGTDRSENIGQSLYSVDRDEYREYTDLWEIYLPEENRLLVFPDKQPTLLLRDAEWDGPKGGPYHFLTFMDVPANAMPLAPTMTLLDLHVLTNVLWNKAARQAERQKTLLPYDGANWKEAERVIKSSDGEGILQDHSTKALREMAFGGADPRTLAMSIQARSMFSMQGGNLDLLAGSGPQSDTATQDELLSAHASGLVVDMMGQGSTAMQGVVRALAWYEWTDPERDMVLRKPIKGTDLSIEVKWSPETRTARFLDFTVELDVYSMQDQTPETRFARLMMVYERILAPNAPLIQQQGGTIDIEHLLKLSGKYLDMNEMGQLVSFPLEGAGAGASETQQTIPEPRQSPVTTRTNVRVNRPGGTQQGQEEALSQLLLGSKMQDSELAGVMRPTG